MIVQNGMLFVVKNKITKPVNLGSGKGVSIKRIVNILNNIYKEKKIKIHWKKISPEIKKD